MSVSTWHGGLAMGNEREHLARWTCGRGVDFVCSGKIEVRAKAVSAFMSTRH